MLSVRLPEPLQSEFESYCTGLGLSKSSVVQTALERYLRDSAVSQDKNTSNDPLVRLIGSGNRKYTTKQIMEMTRGKDWRSKDRRSKGSN